MTGPRAQLTDRPRAQLVIRAGFGLLAVMVAASAVLVSGPVRGLPGVATAGELVQDSTYALAALLVFARVALVRRARAAFALLGVGPTSYGLANTYYFAVVQNLDPEPFPSASDAGWLATRPRSLAARCGSPARRRSPTVAATAGRRLVWIADRATSSREQELLVDQKATRTP